jgi:hypothetical protein
MKLDPGMHIGLHLVSFGKSGVTAALPLRTCVACSPVRKLTRGRRSAGLAGRRPTLRWLADWDVHGGWWGQQAAGGRPRPAARPRPRPGTRSWQPARPGWRPQPAAGLRRIQGSRRDPEGVHRTTADGEATPLFTAAHAARRAYVHCRRQGDARVHGERRDQPQAHGCRGGDVAGHSIIIKMAPVVRAHADVQNCIGAKGPFTGEIQGKWLQRHQILIMAFAIFSLKKHK